MVRRICRGHGLLTRNRNNIVRRAECSSRTAIVGMRHLQPNLEALSEDDRVSLHDELSSWVKTAHPVVNRERL